jgi:hypothetical protein
MTSRSDVENFFVDDVIPEIGPIDFFFSTEKRVDLLVAVSVEVTGS